ncbi:hypothetical protein SCUCBS95973_002775 [Sporothrix curviconia]|uniref:Integral membrane protein n=1 Tax=Sporothrix curviconia TaxID=1260050 RepID=A0ABP0B9P9_9PEZI
MAMNDIPAIGSHQTAARTPGTRSSLADSDSHHSQDASTVIVGRSIDHGDGQMSDGLPSSPQYPDFAHLYGSARSLHLTFGSPIPPCINAVLWPQDSTANGIVNNDGGPIGFVSSHGATGSVQGQFTPWAGSTNGARAWSHADEVEAATPSPRQIWIATRIRRYLTGICCALYLIATVLLIVAQTGSTNARQPSTDIFLFRFNLSVLFDESYGSGLNISDLALSEATADSLGLHNYYQAGLWGYCVGDSVSDFTSCSRPRLFYWFNPVAILLSEMLNTSTLTLPVRVQTVLNILRVVSGIMFGTCFVGVILAGVLIFVSPLVLLTRWLSLPVGLLAAVTAMCLFVGSGLAMTMALAYRLAGSAINQLNILVTVGDIMFGLVWAATAVSFAGLVMHAILAFCGPSVRDARTGRRTVGQLMEPHAVEKAAPTRPSIMNKLQDKGGALVAALKKRSPWSSPLPIHTPVTRSMMVPVTPPPSENRPPVWGVVS